MKKTSARFKSRLFMPFAISLSLGISVASTLAYAQTQTPASETATAATRPLTYALISAVGDRFTIVSQKQSVGSNVIDNFSRKVIKIQGNVLNSAILRGLDKALADSDPTSVRIFMSLEAAELDNVYPQDREAVALGKIVSAVEKMPQRKDWDKIIVVAPKYMQSEYSGMGSKLSGLGVYIQALYSSKLTDTGTESSGSDISINDASASGTTAPDGSKSVSTRYIAPFSYLQAWTLDAKTLAVIDKNARHDFTKLFDKQSTAPNAALTIPDDVLASRILTLAERSAAGALGTDLSATVEIGDVTAIDPKTGAATKPGTPKK